MDVVLNPDKCFALVPESVIAWAFSGAGGQEAEKSQSVLNNADDDAVFTEISESGGSKNELGKAFKMDGTGKNGIKLIKNAI